MELTIDERSRLDFVLSLRRRWADLLYPVLREQADSGADKLGVETRMRRQPAYPWFAFLERASQKMLWRDVSDAVRAHCSGALGETDGPAKLLLDPTLDLPSWYTDWDIHLQPGGLWRDDSCARVYAMGAKLVMLGENDEFSFHRLFTRTAMPDTEYGRIVDLGCGFGKSTWPLKERFPDAEVIGIDLAAPCLRLAFDCANHAGLAIDFRQACATKTALADASVDLVTSTMLIHEMPLEAIEQTLVECARILAPGGILRFLDFTRTGDSFRDFAMIEHGQRNNEPFMPGVLKADLPAMCRSAGLVNARWVAFDERGGGRLDRMKWPNRPEWHFPWAVLETEKGR